MRVGPYTIYAAGGSQLSEDRADEFDILIPLSDLFGHLEAEDHVVVECHLPDFGGVPEDWREILEQRIIPLLERCEQTGEKAVCYCHAGHGRTGTLLASLIALLESEKETPDPIVAVRERHCSHAVETRTQAEGIFALRGQEVPEGHSFHY
ncbi:MAG: hypothetical protein U9Q03_04200 [Patescibacteria group bacterium]|nr:hypothetical protein [Patescibacteria group bacterium]